MQYATDSISDNDFINKPLSIAISETLKVSIIKLDREKDPVVISKFTNFLFHPCALHSSA